MAKVSHDSETPAHGQQVMTACAFIYHDFDGVTRVFLPKRADTKKFLPGLYELPGGHIDFGEDIVEGLKREIREELNMTLRLGDPFSAFTYANNVKGSHSIEVIYFAQFIEPVGQVSIQPDDHSRYDWFSREEVMAHKADISATELMDRAGIDDDAEYLTMLKGFDLLQGQPLDFAQA